MHRSNILNETKDKKHEENYTKTQIAQKHWEGTLQTARGGKNNVLHRQGQKDKNNRILVGKSASKKIAEQNL